MKRNDEKDYNNELVELLNWFAGRGYTYEKIEAEARIGKGTISVAKAKKKATARMVYMLEELKKSLLNAQEIGVSEKLITSNEKLEFYQNKLLESQTTIIELQKEIMALNLENSKLKSDLEKAQEKLKEKGKVVSASLTKGSKAKVV